MTYPFITKIKLDKIIKQSEGDYDFFLYLLKQHWIQNK